MRDPTANPSSPSAAEFDTTRRQGDEDRELELELIRIRAEVKLIRLETRAAEIELRLRRSARGLPQSISSEAENTSPTTEPFPQFGDVDKLQPQVDVSLDSAAASPQVWQGGRITSWEQLLAAAGLDQPTSSQNARIPAASKAQIAEPAVGFRPKDEVAQLPAPVFNAEPKMRIDPPHAKIAAPRSAIRAAIRPTSAAVVAEVQTDPQSEPKRRRRPVAWIVSVVAHAAVLLLLAGITLSVQQPLDQIALSGSVRDSADEPIETMVLEQTEQPETAEPSQQALATANPMGDTSTAVFDVTGPAAAPLASASSLSQLLGQAGAGTSVKSDVSTTFFGADGGGNHFVYLLDSSKSMDDVSRDGFDVARNEVLRAVDSLTPEQRFYVIFFGKETLRMRVGEPAKPDPRSVYATDENKLALKRWAMSLQMQAGRWPEEAMEFAFELRPDCIFLLTDGAMPEYVPEFVASSNIVDTLLDGPKPKSIIHTIGFHNPVGEPILRKIATENGGSYNFVPAVNARR